MQLERLRTLCLWCEASSPFYRDRWRRAGFDASQLHTIDDIRRIPPVTKTDFLDDQAEQPPFGRRLAVAEQTLARVYLSSGTTGIGQEVHCLDPVEWYACAAPLVWQAGRIGLDRGDGFAVTLPLGMQMGGPYLANAADQVGLRLYLLSAHATDERIRYLERFAPAALQVTPAYGARLQEAGRSAGFDRWPFPMKALFVSAEAYTPRWADAVQAYWGGRLLEYYGTTQAGMGHAVSCEQGATIDGGAGVLHNCDPCVICEVLGRDTGAPVEPGDEGEVVVTSLFKYSSPVVRFLTDDKAIRESGRRCPCPVTWDGLRAGDIGRYDDMMKIKGQNVWPAAFHAAIDEALPGAEYRGRVLVDPSGHERVIINVEAADATSLGPLAASLRAATNVSVELEAVPVGSLERFEFKSRRWEDTRKSDRDVIAYREVR
jgi:phenylacetate-CoA ligase